MLEIIDHTIPSILKLLNPNVTDKEIHFVEKSYAIKYRQDILSQTDNKADVLPFASFVRSETKRSRYNARLNKVGIPYNASSVKPTILSKVPVQPVDFYYDVIFWEKDGVQQNELLKKYYAKYLKLTAFDFALEDSTVYRLTVLYDADPIPTIFENDRNDFVERGQIFLLAFRMFVRGFIPDFDGQTSQFMIKKVIVNVDAGQNDKEKLEFKVDKEGNAIRIPND